MKSADEGGSDEPRSPIEESLPGCPHRPRAHVCFDCYGHALRAAEAQGRLAGDKRANNMEAAIRWATGEQPLADGRWFDEREFGHTQSVPRYWWRSVLRLYSGIDEGTAAQPPPDSSAALREQDKQRK